MLADVDWVRAERLNEVHEQFRTRQAVVVRGASGQGKSTLAFRYMRDFTPDGLRFYVRYVVGNGGEESACGWCKDRWGLSWQITPRTLTDALAAGGGEAKRAFEAVMMMKKIDVATIEAARRG
jgi:hypothetical protein